MNKKAKIGGFFGALAVAAAAIIATHQPHHSTPTPPPVPTVPTYTLTVHVCDGDCTADHKIPNASVTYTENQPVFVTDGAGNVSINHVSAGAYQVCVTADHFVRQCRDAFAVPAGGELSVALVRDAITLAPLGTNGHVFTVNGQPWRWMGVSAFALLHRHAAGDDIQPFLDAYRGFNVLRVWCYTPVKDWGAQAWEVPSVDQVRAFAAFVGAQGWRVELTILTDDDPARLAWAQTFVPQLAGIGNLILEEGNEPETHKAINTAALDGVVSALGVPWTSGNYEDAAKMRRTYGVAHTGRDGEWPRRAHDLLDFYNGGGPNAPTDPPHRFPIIADEPAKLQDVSGDRENDWVAYFAASALLGGGATFHSETGKFGQPPTPDEAVLAAAALRGLTAFPPDVPNAYAYVHDTADEAATGSLRTYRFGPYGVRIRPKNGAILILP